MAFDPSSFAPNPNLIQQGNDRRQAILRAMQARLDPATGIGKAPPLPGAPMQSAAMNPMGPPAPQSQPSFAPPPSAPPPMPMNNYLAPQTAMTMPPALNHYMPEPPMSAVSPPSPQTNYGGGDIQNLITKHAQEAGVDPKYMLAVAKQESNFKPDAKAKTSSAGGLFQFPDKTWKAYGKGDKYDPVANTQAAIKFTKDNQNYLAKRGVEPTPGATYLAHFFGAGGATSVLKNPNDLVSDHLSANAIKANPFLAGKTGSDMLSWAEKKMNYSPTPSSVGNLAPKTAPAPSQTPTFMKTGSSDMASNG